MACRNKFSSVNGRASTCLCSNEEEQMTEPMNTLTVSASQPTCKYHCNDIEIMMPLTNNLHALLFDVPKVWYGRACPHNQQKERAQQFQC